MKHCTFINQITEIIFHQRHRYGATRHGATRYGATRYDATSRSLCEKLPIGAHIFN